MCPSCVHTLAHQRLMVLARMTAKITTINTQSLGWIVIRTKRMVSELVSGLAVRCPQLAAKFLLPLPLRGFRAYHLPKITIMSMVIVMLSGCAAPVAQYAYQGISSGTSLATNKSIPEHALSYITSANCSLFNWAFRDKDYLCEVEDPGRVYNRSGI